MTEKIPITGTAWKSNVQTAVDLIQEKNRFMFCASLDPDSIGSMLALALYLRLLNKTVYMVVPDPLGSNLDFIHKIITYNGIHVIDHPEKVTEIKENVDAVMFFDTANTKLLPFYPIINEHFISRQLPVIEIDHHFGTDSEELTRNGVKLFRKANANTEIIGEFLLRIHERFPHSPNPLNFRNILLSLITGLLCDTLGGKVVHFQEDYEYWMDKLSESLRKETRWRAAKDNRPADDRTTKFADPHHLFEYLNRLTEEQESCIDSLSSRIVFDGGVGLLNLLDSTYAHVRDYCQPFDTEWFSEVRGFMLNIVPEKSGKVGILCYQGRDAHGKDCIFIKMRRAVEYSGFDLRMAEDKIRETFDGLYMGGGGHAGAVSFRIHLHEEEKFLRGIEKVSVFIKQKLA